MQRILYSVKQQPRRGTFSRLLRTLLVCLAAGGLLLTVAFLPSVLLAQDHDANVVVGPAETSARVVHSPLEFEGTRRFDETRDGNRRPSAPPVLVDPLHVEESHLDFSSVSRHHRLFATKHVVLTTFWSERRVVVPWTEVAAGSQRPVSPSIDGSVQSKAPLSSFYHGRSVPSFDWVIVFIVSLFDVTCPQLLSLSGGLYNKSISPCEVGLVFFCDVNTADSVSGRLASVKGGAYRQLLASGHLHFVVVGGVRNRSAALRTAEDSSPFVYVPRPAYVDHAWSSTVPNGANNFRFALYRDFLTEWKARSDDGTVSRNSNARDSIALLSDNTDVLFQWNPFYDAQPATDAVVDGTAGRSTATCFPSRLLAMDRTNVTVQSPPVVPSPPWVFFTLEDASKTFRNEKYNRRWVSCYGHVLLKQMAKQRQRISCAGVTYGTVEGVLRYTRAQIAELTRVDLMRCAAEVIHATLDQATHNVLLYRQRDTVATEAGVSTMPPAKSPNTFHVLTAQSSDVAACVFHGNFGLPRFRDQYAMVRAADGGLVPATVEHRSGSERLQRSMLTDANGVPFVIVHQYTSDRIPAMMRIARERYL